MVGGNLTAALQVSTTTKNEIGEKVQEWHDVVELTGFIDLSGETTNRTTYNAKIQESTHIFIGNYKPIPDNISIDSKVVKISTENARMVANSKRYDVMLIDDPMDLHRQLEIYLKYTGGQ